MLPSHNRVAPVPPLCSCDITGPRSWASRLKALIINDFPQKIGFVRRADLVLLSMITTLFFRVFTESPLGNLLSENINAHQFDPHPHPPDFASRVFGKIVASDRLSRTSVIELGSFGVPGFKSLLLFQTNSFIAKSID